MRPAAPLGCAMRCGCGHDSRCLHSAESLGAKEQPEREELSEWSRNGGIRAQRALAAAQVTTFVTEKEAGRGKSI